MEDFKKYFKLPLVQDNIATFMVWDSDNNRAFDIIYGDKPLHLKIVKILNGEEEERITNKITHKDGIILVDDAKLLMVRSWGRLTGNGHSGLGLSSEKAIEIQNGFCDWIIETLKTKEDLS